jgi:hypothetical protein
MKPDTETLYRRILLVSPKRRRLENPPQQLYRQYGSFGLIYSRNISLDNGN